MKRGSDGGIKSRLEKGADGSAQSMSMMSSGMDQQAFAMAQTTMSDFGGMDGTASATRFGSMGQAIGQGMGVMGGNTMYPGMVNGMAAMPGLNPGMPLNQMTPMGPIGGPMNPMAMGGMVPRMGPMGAMGPMQPMQPMPAMQPPRPQSTSQDFQRQQQWLFLPPNMKPPSNTGTGSASARTEAERIEADKRRSRGNYKCSKCGLPKKGHVCAYQPRLRRRDGETETEALNAAVQVEMDPHMTIRELKLSIQGMPESYSTKMPHVQDMGSMHGMQPIMTAPSMMGNMTNGMSTMTSNSAHSMQEMMLPAHFQSMHMQPRPMGNMGTSMVGSQSMNGPMETQAGKSSSGRDSTDSTQSMGETGTPEGAAENAKGTGDDQAGAVEASNPEDSPENTR